MGRAACRAVQVEWAPCGASEEEADQVGGEQLRCWLDELYLDLRPERKDERQGKCESERECFKKLF